MPRTIYYCVNFKKQQVLKVKAASRNEATTLAKKNKFSSDVVFTKREWNILNKMTKRT